MIPPSWSQVYRQRTFARLMDKGLWSVATQFVGNDTALQQELVLGLAIVDMEQAEALRQLLGLPPHLIAQARLVLGRAGQGGGQRQGLGPGVGVMMVCSAPHAQS
ncbi:MAG: hypothetical protein ACT6SG_20585 [Hydrogenophaga sp.]|uniref:hypothetical protein n=1 Tax=Hydrogenophaga sp. TaxID=1904254 RepID=UPI004036F9DE